MPDNQTDVQVDPSSTVINRDTLRENGRAKALGPNKNDWPELEQAAQKTLESLDVTDFPDITPEQKQHWRLTGELPAKSDAPPASKEPAASPAGEKKAAPASQPDTQRSKPKNAESRIRDLVAENKRLTEQLAAKPQPAQSVTQTSQPAAPKTEAKPTDDPEPQRAHKPDGSKWENWDEYAAAVRAWDRREAVRAVQAETAKSEQVRKAQEQYNQVAQTWTEKRDAFLQEKGVTLEDYDRDTTAALNGKVNQATALYLLASEQGPALTYHLAQNPKLVAELVTLGPAAVAVKLARLEVSLSKPSEPPSPVRTSRMPKPATDIGARNTAPADEEMAAVASGDFRAFRKLANANALRK